jgi:hypothetical protein
MPKLEEPKLEELYYKLQARIFDLGYDNFGLILEQA